MCLTKCALCSIDLRSNPDCLFIQQILKQQQQHKSIYNTTIVNKEMIIY